MFEATIYIPKPGSTLDKTLIPGSGIVGQRGSIGLIIFYEGNRYGAASLLTWPSRVRCAAGRMFARYGTIAKQLVLDETTLIPVGSIKAAELSETYQLDLITDQLPALSAYIGATMTEEQANTERAQRLARETWL